MVLKLSVYVLSTLVLPLKTEKRNTVQCIRWNEILVTGCTTYCFYNSRCSRLQMIRWYDGISESVVLSLTRRNMNFTRRYPDSKIHGANMGPTWVLSAPDGPHVDPMTLAIRVAGWIHKCNACMGLLVSRSVAEAALGLINSLRPSDAYLRR